MCSPVRDWSKYPKTSYVPVAPTLKTCKECGEGFKSTGTRRYCSTACRNLVRERRRMFSCSGCGAPMWASRSKADVPICLECRRAQHGTRRTYRAGCRCAPCRDRAAADQRKYAESYRMRTGESIYKRFRKPDGRSHWITDADRQLVYERDGWICQLCLAPVDPLLPTNDRFAATLDHIECRSWSLVPDDRPENLRLAHRSCNSARRDRVA